MNCWSFVTWLYYLNIVGHWTSWISLWFPQDHYNFGQETACHHLTCWWCDKAWYKASYHNIIARNFWRRIISWISRFKSHPWKFSPPNFGRATHTYTNGLTFHKSFILKVLSSYNNTSLWKFLPWKFPALPTYKLIIPTFNCICIPTINLLTADDVKVILNEGMPHHRNPFDKGRLIINFKVSVDDCLHLHLWIALFSGQVPLPWISQWQETKRAG